MAKITATFERYFQYKAYEGEKIVLTVEDTLGKDDDPLSAVAALHGRLAEIGDQITAKRLAQTQPNPPAQDPKGPNW